ncbi:MAG: hypothetical protein HC782_05695 [Gammaproteobacteria bacterium]|nr:hypothetical protein [Gammaproteobacteria bacterium]
MSILSSTLAEAPTFIAPAKGTYTFQVTVDDGDGGVVSKSIDVVVKNRAPVANAGADISANVSGAVQLDGRLSSDPDGDTLTYVWVQSAGDVVSLRGADTATPIFDAPGEPTALEFSVDSH